MYTDPFAHLVRMEEYRNVDQKILEKLPERPERSHKGMFGKALCIAGSVNMAGAAYLCAGATYRSGAGLVRILTPEENRVILQTLLPEAVMTTFEQNEREALDNILEEALSWATVAAIGPGLGRKPWAYHMMKLTLQKFHGPLVIDADALNILSEHMEWLEQHEGNVILTPHVGEFSRLTGVESWEIGKDISGWAAAFAREHHCICILKDAPIVILDEATASVDADNESYIQEAITQLCRGKTLLVIAHRLNTIRHADEILVIDQGRIVQAGDHDRLMAEEGIYRRFITARSNPTGWCR